MIVEIKVPSPGESITEVQIARWLKKDGDYVERDEELCEIDSDKATLTVNAEQAGKVKILVKEGDTVEVGKAICSIDTDAKAPAKQTPPQEESIKTKKAVPPVTVAPAASNGSSKSESKSGKNYADKVPSVSAQKLMAENKLTAEQVSATGKGGRITKADAMNAMSANEGSAMVVGSREIKREKMSMLRKKIAQRLVAVKNETAMLTTFNEVDMSAIIEIRKKHKESFKEKHGVGLGFMSFFTKAVTEALALFPAVNAMIDGEEVQYHSYADIGIAVSTPKGLMVPVMRNAEALSLAGIEAAIGQLAGKARDGALTLEDMKGGTFTITNGGVFGSLMSTPIINPPQSAILGMHNIVERPMAVDGQVVIKPMMYVALSYDHRIIDGRESVSFLVKVKEMLENPILMLHQGKDPLKKLLQL